MIEIRCFQNKKLVRAIGFDQNRVIIKAGVNDIAILSAVDSHTLAHFRTAENGVSFTLQRLITETFANNFHSFALKMNDSNGSIIEAIK